MTVPPIELTHLRYFIALAEECHFGRAAARLSIAQPPLTRQIQLLEARLECRLFERTSRRTRLTAAGEEFLESARAVVQAADRAVEAMRRLGRGEAGSLVLGTAPSLMLGALPHWIRRFRKKHGGVDFRLSEMSTSAILQAVEAGTVDLGLIRGMDRYPEVETHRKWTEAMIVLAPRDFDLGREPVPVARLKGEPFVFFPRQIGPSFYDEVMGHCRRAGFQPAVAQEARQWGSIVSLVSAGMGVSIGPECVGGLLRGAVRVAPLKGFRTTVRLVGRKGAANPAVGRFLEIVGESEDRGLKG